MRDKSHCSSSAVLGFIFAASLACACSQPTAQNCTSSGRAFPDSDGDGYGAAVGGIEACTPPAGFVAMDGDCNDSRNDVHPAAAPLENLDADCDGKIDLDVDGDGTSDRTPAGFTFDPSTQKHVELDVVDAGVPFEVVVHDGEIAPEGVSLVSGSAFAKVLRWDASRRTLSGTISTPGIYRFPLSVCTVYPYAAAACALPANRRLDLVHLTVRGSTQISAPMPAARGPFMTGAKTISLDVAGALSTPDVAALPMLASGDRPERSAETAALGSVSPTRVMFPATAAGVPATGSFPLLVILHGNGYHWDDYDTIGELLASQGIVVVVPQFPTGLLGACGSSLSSIERAEFGERAMKWALAESARPDGFFAGRLDPTKVVIAGHSWGGTAAEWAAPVIGARVVASWDPIGLLQNVLQWQSCNSSRRTGVATRDHLRATWRDISTPFLALDAGRSGFRTTLAAYSGLFSHSPFLHVSTEGTYHEDFLDNSEAQQWLNVGACYSESRIAAHREDAARWLTAMIRRYVDDDITYDELVHGPAALAAPKTMVATRRGDSSSKLIDSSALHAFGSSLSSPQANAAQGTAVIEGASGVVDLAPAARTMIRVDVNGNLDVFSQANLTYFSGNSDYWKMLVPETKSEAALVERFGTTLDLHAYRRLNFELIVTAKEQTGFCYKSEPDVLPQATGVVVRIRSADGRTADITGSALAGADRTYLGLPVTRSADLSSVAKSVDLAHISAIEIRVPAASVLRSVAFDDLRALR